MEPNVSSWGSILRDFGYPAVVFFGTIYALSRLAKWAKPHAEGVVADHRALVQQTTESVKAMELATVKTQGELQVLTNLIRELASSTGATERLLIAHDGRASAFIDNFAERLAALENCGAPAPDQH
jgi:hypothetical protein